MYYRYEVEATSNRTGKDTIVGAFHTLAAAVELRTWARDKDSKKHRSQFTYEIRDNDNLGVIIR